MVIGIIRLERLISKFNRRHHVLVSKFSVGLKSLLHQDLSEPDYYDDFVYKFKKIMGRTDFSYQCRKMIIHHKRIGYDLNVKRQSARWVINPITVVTLLHALIARLWIGRHTLWWPRPKAIHFSWLGPELFFSVAWSTGALLLLQISSGVVCLADQGSPSI